MGLLLQSEAAARATQMFSCGEAHERPADLIADIIQFCLYHDIDFEAELDTARMYVTEEQSIDSDTDEELVANLEARKVV
jgi:hypothetical protein